MPQRSRPVAWLILVAGLVFLSVAVFWVTTRGETSIVHDSPDFKDALGVWHPVIAGCCHTPRAIKRFTNRVRFFAMRQRSQSDEPSHWQYVLGRIRGWLGYETPKVILPAEAGRISEPLLVGLCALARSDTVWLDHTDAWRWLHEGIVSGSPPAGMDPGYCDCVRECIGQHQSRFGEFAPTEEQRATLQTMFGEAKNLGD